MRNSAFSYYRRLRLTNSRRFSSSESAKAETSTRRPNLALPHHQRVWTADGSSHTWTERVADQHQESLTDIVGRIENQELAGSRLRFRQHGVLHDDPATDMGLLTTNYTVAAIASALRDREDVLQQAAALADEERFDELRKLLKNFHPRYVIERRKQRHQANITEELNSFALESIRKALMRRPRTVTQAHSKRAGVCVPLCTVDGVPSLLLEKRAASIRAHPDEVCLPGGMVSQDNDPTIVQTCLREMLEEIGGIDPSNITVLGVLRCNWGTSSMGCFIERTTA
jgi:ADP-ribose pyrophosphatase YjhB (NUDIX family)